LETVTESDLISRQSAYYEARAGEYDEWWERRGRYDRGPEFRRAWNKDIGQLEAWLDEEQVTGDLLEIAAGTGKWTRSLAVCATSVTALDSSPAMLAINAAKCRAGNVDYVVADIFDWQPTRRYDATFSAFWISHIPAERWAAYWALLGTALRPGGKALFIDSAHPSGADATSSEVEVKRRLNDGSKHTVHKRYWKPSELRGALGRVGWEATVGETDFAFLFGAATLL
jgi:SAM-dependent methyltransferase